MDTGCAEDAVVRRSLKRRLLSSPELSEESDEQMKSGDVNDGDQAPLSDEELPPPLSQPRHARQMSVEPPPPSQPRHARSTSPDEEGPPPSQPRRGGSTLHDSEGRLRISWPRYARLRQ